MMCKAAEGRLDHSRVGKDTDDLKKGKKPAFEDDDMSDFDTLGEEDDFDFAKEMHNHNSTNSTNATNSTNSTSSEKESGALELSKVAIFSSMLFMIAL